MTFAVGDLVWALNGRKPRYKPAAQFIAELEDLRNLGWSGSVFVVDDNFIGNKRRCRELLHSIIDWRKRTGTRMVFITEASVNMAGDAELLELMVAAGFKKVFLGLETPSAASLRECRKLQNLRGDLAESVRTIQAAGLEVMGDGSAIVSVHVGENLPTVCAEARRRVVGVPVLHIAIDGDAVIVVEDDELAQSQGAGQGARFVGNTLH